MDLDEWELLPREEFIDHQTHTFSNLSNTKSVIHMNYFQNCIDHTAVKHCPAQKDQTFRGGCDQKYEKVIDHIAVKHCPAQNDQTSRGGCDQENGNCIVVKHYPAENDQTSRGGCDQENGNYIDHRAVKHCPDQNDQTSRGGFDKETRNCIDHRAVKHCPDQNDQTSKEGYDQETISQVLRMEENKFVDIKMDFPMSEKKDLSAYDELDEKDEDEEEEDIKKGEDNSKNGGLNNVWKWAMSGIGAVFSFGFVAASVSLVALGKRSCNKDHHSYNTSEIHFQIYSHDKRMKRVVKRTKRLSEAIGAVRGAPYMTRAHITVGGYYDGL